MIHFGQEIEQSIGHEMEAAADYSDDEHDDGDAIDVDASYPIVEAPSRLFALLDECGPELLGWHIEHKIDGRWRISGELHKLGDSHSVVPSEIVSRICQACQTRARILGSDSEFRCKLQVSDASKPRGRAYRTCGLVVVIDADDHAVVHDVDAFDRRQEVAAWKGLVDSQRAQLEKADERTDAMFSKMMEMAEALVGGATAAAAGYGEVGTGMGTVVQASVTALANAAQLSERAHQKTTTIELAKLDSESEAAKLKIVMMLVSKFGGPLMKQITNAIAGRPKNARIPELESAEQEAHAEAQAETTTTVADDDASIHKRLSGWLEKLGEARIAKLKEIVGEHAEAFIKATDDEEAQAALEGLHKDFNALSDKEGGAEELGAKLTQLGELLGDELTHEFVAMLPDD